MRKVNTNVAPYPEELESLVSRCEYRPGWLVELAHLDRGQGSEGLTLTITTLTVDTYNPDQPIRVHHFFPVPPAAYDERSWRRWLFEQFRLVESHECAEFFQIRDDSLLEADDLCADCPHTMTLHDGRNESCRGDDCNDHRFTPVKPRYSRPYAPSHGPGNDPYLIREIGTDLDRRTSFRGEVTP